MIHYCQEDFVVIEITGKSPSIRKYSKSEAFGILQTNTVVILPYKAKSHLRCEISKGSTFLSDRIL